MNVDGKYYVLDSMDNGSMCDTLAEAEAELEEFARNLGYAALYRLEFIKDAECAPQSLEEFYGVTPGVDFPATLGPAR